MTLLKDSAATNLQLIGQATDPAVNPAAGNYKFYILDDDTVWIMDDAGVSTQLASAGAVVVDAADVTYTPAVDTDWDSDTDPGDVDGALDQLAQRVDDIEGAGGSHTAVTLDADAAALLDLSTQEIGLDTQDANTVFAGPASGVANEPTFRALVPLDLASDPDDGEILTVASGALSWAAAEVVDAADVTYTPTTAADWDGDADPGDVDQALDQLAERTTDIEERYDAINILIGDGANVITTGVKAGFKTEAAFTIVAWEIGEILNTSGAIVIDLWVDSYANFPPTDADSITNGSEPEVAASGAKAQDTDLADWSGEAVPAGSWIFVNVDSCTDMKLVCLTLKVLKT